MPRRSKFNLGSYKLLTCDMGYLVPIQIKDVIPGDIFRGASQAFIRMQPMLAPIMHPIHVRIHHYFVPYRLIWDDFEEFITKNDEELFVPRIEFDENNTGSLADYFGVPPLAKGNDKIEVSALPFRAYNMIWNEYYRDADLQAEIPVMTATPAKGTFDDETPVDLRSVCWNKDYFTLARPWEQKGESVAIPITSSSIPKKVSTCITISFGMKNNPRALKFWRQTLVSCTDNNLYSSDYWIGKYVELHDKEPGFIVFDGWFNLHMNGGASVGHGCMDVELSASVVGRSVETYQGSHDVPNAFITINDYSVIVKMYYPVQELGMVSVSTLRSAIAEQRLRERKAKYGSEYKDLLASYGIGYNDARMQRPEFVSGGSTLLRISEVIQTAPSETLGVVGDMKGYGLGLAKSNGYKWRFPEHGIFMTLMSVLPSTMYSDGLERYLLKFRADDFYQREIASLVPSQEIYKQELFATATQDEVFGYIDRYDEYRFGYSTIAGDFRTTLDYWHMARKFTEAPSLNGDFVRSSPTKRIFAEQTKHELLVMAQNMCRARRILRKRASSGAL